MIHLSGTRAVLPTTTTAYAPYGYSWYTEEGLKESFDETSF
jgi:hypothetical protein